VGAELNRYSKGARNERELLNRFYRSGYSVVRAAGSGVNALGPDILALKDGVCLSFECKAWDRTSISLDEEHYMKLVEWERNSGSRTYVAWRMSGEEWLFVSIGEFTKRERNYSVTKKEAFMINRRFEEIVGYRNSNVSAEAQEAGNERIQSPEI
jgi:Holliday junction resolvase